MKIYVASSWRNDQQPMIVAALRKAGHEVYDFRNPGEGKKGFDWVDIDINWEQWDNKQYRQALDHPVAIEGFANDFDGMVWADACVMVMPCGRSAHSEAGWMQGQGKPTIVFQTNDAEPELMYKLYELVTDSLEEVIHHLKIIDMAEKLDQALGE